MGETFAHELGSRGADLVLAARSVDRLEAAAQQIHEEYGVDVITVPADLAQPGAAGRLFAAATADGRIDAVINNAGFTSHGDVADTDADTLGRLVALNVATLVDLTRLALPEMRDRARGAIVNIASTAAFQPMPGWAAYGASKSFVLSFTEALAAECRGSGVEVVCVCPGPVDTGFFDSAGVSDQMFGRPAAAEEVVAAALAGLGKRTVVIPGVRNRTMALGSRFLPRALVVRVAGALVRRG